LTGVRVTAWNRERRRPLPDMSLHDPGPRAPRVDFASTDRSGTPRASNHTSSNSSARTGSDTKRKIAEIRRARKDKDRAAKQARSGIDTRQQQARAAASAREVTHRSHVREIASHGTECAMPGAWVE
jgi:hypothetical protein